MIQRIWRDAGQRPSLFADINAMTERIQRDRGSGTPGLDFKTGNGGMVEADFLVQAPKCAREFGIRTGRKQ